MIRSVTFSAIVLCAVALIFVADTPKPLAQACPSLTPAEIAAIEAQKGVFPENAWYARAFCVSIAEADRRMELQNRGAIGPRTEPGPRAAPAAPDASIGALQEALQAKETRTFAGMWIQHQPTYGVMVAFTRDAAATLAKYTKDPVYQPIERAGPNLAELGAAQERLAGDLTRLKVHWFAMGSNEKLGKIEVSLGQNAAPIRAAAARGDLVLPEFVTFTEPKPFPIAAPPAPAGDRRLKGFPQFGYRTDGAMRTLVGVRDVPARLQLRDGCLWLAPEGEAPKVALWEQSMAPDLSKPEIVAVLSLFGGAKVTVDSDVVLSGLQPGEETPPGDVVGAGVCAGPYRVVRGITAKADWDAERRKEAIAARMQTLGSRAAAEKDYAADMARVAALTAWKTRALAAHGDVVADIWINAADGTASLFHTAARTKEALVPASLLPFVTAQVTPQGARALEAARADFAAQIAAAGIEAHVGINALGGYVQVSAADLDALSKAAVARKIVFPPLVRLESGNQGPVLRTDIPLRNDPDAVMYPLEAHPDFAAIRALVDETPMLGPGVAPAGAPDSSVAAKKPTKAQSLSQTHYLIAYGLTLRDITALRRAGFDPVIALEDMNGRQTVQKRALTATDIVVAEPVGIDAADSGEDGYAATVRWRVIETLKGETKPGVQLRQRLASGMRPDAAGRARYGQAYEEPVLLPGLPNSLAKGSRWVLHLNKALYRHAAYVQGGPGAARSDGDWYINVAWMPASLITADGVARPVTTYPEPIALNDLRTAVAPIQKALVLARSSEAGAQRPSSSGVVPKR